MSVHTSSKRCKYSRAISKEPPVSKICVVNNSSFVDTEQKTTDAEHNNDTHSKNYSSSRLNESEIHETLQEIKSEVCSSNFMLSDAMNGFKENEILKTLWEMKAENCNFQKEVLARLLSIETEINNLKNVLSLSMLPKSHIRFTRPGTSEPLVETEKNTLKRSVCSCKYPKTQTTEGKTNPSIIYLESSCETELNNMSNVLCACKHPDIQIVKGSTKTNITEKHSETEINNKDNDLGMYNHHETQIIKGNTKSSITEIPIEKEINNTDRDLCICKHPETKIARGNTRPSITETPSETEINKINNDLCMCKNHEKQIVRKSTKPSITETLSETDINNIDNALCMCKHNETETARKITRPSILELSSETEINQSGNSLCMYRHSETSITNDIVRPNSQNSQPETDEIDTKNILSICSHPWTLIASVATKSNLPKLPVDSIESLQSVEQWLEDKDNVQLLTQHFCTIGGDHVKDTTKRILSRSFTQNIAVNINWTGKNHKYPLSQGCLAKVIIAAVKLTHKYENITEKMVEELIKSWFRFAKDRDGGRERRRSTNNSLIKGCM